MPKQREKDGKIPNNYVVVNEDMKCAETVWKLIEDEISSNK